MAIQGFQITAENQFYWQALHVDATDESAARATVVAYLTGEDNQRDEAYEYESAQDAAQDDKPAPAREDYSYRITSVKTLDEPTGYTTPDLHASGGNS